MGVKARERRKQIKARARAEGLTKEDEKSWIKPRSHTTPMGFRVDDFGELRRVETKAEARARFLRNKSLLRVALHDVYNDLTRRAVEELLAEEDARVFALLDKAAGLLQEVR